MKCTSSSAVVIRNDWLRGLSGSADSGPKARAGLASISAARCLLTQRRAALDRLSA